MSAKTAVGRFSRDESPSKFGRQTIIGVIGAAAALLVIGAGIGSQLAVRSNTPAPSISSVAPTLATSVASPSPSGDIGDKGDDTRSQIATLSSEVAEQKHEIETLTRTSNSEAALKKEVAVLTARVTALEAAVITSDPTLSANLTKPGK